MRTALVAIAASLVFGGTAVAAERAHGHVAHCTNVADLKAQLKAKDKLETLSRGAFHIAEGLWMATPPLSPVEPDVDGAAIITIDNASKLIFTHGKEGCISTAIPPFDLPEKWVRVLSAAKTAPDEKAEPKDELSL